MAEASTEGAIQTAEVPQGPTPEAPEQPQRIGFGARIKNWLRGSSERSKDNAGLSVAEFGEMYEGLRKAVGNEGSSSNPEVSMQNTKSLAERFIVDPNFAAFFPKIDAIVLGENRMVVRPNFNKLEGKEPNSVTLDELGEKLDKEMEKRGIRRVPAIL